MGLGAHKEQRPRRRARLIRAIVAGVAIVGLAWVFRADWPRAFDVRPNAAWLATSCALLIFALCGQVAAWRWNLAHLGARVGYRPLFHVYYITNLARYIPGKIWSLAGMVAGGVRLGVDPGVLSASVFLGLTSSLVSGLCLGALAAWQGGLSGVFSPALAVVPLCALGAMWPPVFRRWSGWIMRRIRPGTVLAPLGPRLLLRSTLHYGLVWCLYAGGIGALAVSVGAQMFWVYFAAFPLAYLAGYAALFAPGGWGVREGALVVLVGGGPTALAVALLQRISLTVLEIVFFAYSIWSWRHD